MSAEVVRPQNFSKSMASSYIELEAEISRLRRLLDTKQASLESIIISNKNMRRQINTIGGELNKALDENKFVKQHIGICNENMEILKEQRLRMETHAQQQRYHNMQLKNRVERLLINSRLKTTKLKRTNNENIKLYKENSLLKKALIKLQTEINRNRKKHSRLKNNQLTTLLASTFDLLCKGR